MTNASSSSAVLLARNATAVPTSAVAMHTASTDDERGIWSRGTAVFNTWA